MVKSREEGFQTIEALMIFLVALPFILASIDIIFYFYKSISTSLTATSVTRMVGIQGGVLHTAPAGFPGGNDGYMDRSELQDYLQKKMKAVGFEDDEWTLKIDGKVYTSATSQSTGEYDYLEDISVVLITQYDFPFISAFLPGDQTVKIICSRPTISEWKYNYDDWIGE